MLDLILLIAVICSVGINKLYAVDGKLPPPSTAKGKQARILWGAVVFVTACTLGLEAMHIGGDKKQLLPFIQLILIGAIVAIVRFIRYKDRR